MKLFHVGDRIQTSTGQIGRVVKHGEQVTIRIRGNGDLVTLSGACCYHYPTEEEIYAEAARIRERRRMATPEDAVDDWTPPECNIADIAGRQPHGPGGL